MRPQPAPTDDALLSLFARHGFGRIETAVLQAATLYLELSGEDIRRRLFATQDGSGAELCLRPEHTIPVCREHIASGREAGAYCYLGPVFRQRPGESGEFSQAGFESIGGVDEADADAAALALALEALDLFAPARFTAKLGDVGLLDAVGRALGLTPATGRRLRRTLAAGLPASAAFDGEGGSDRDYAGLLAAIEGQDPAAARAFVEDVISIAGVASVGGRSAGEIAERFLQRAQNRAGLVSSEARAVLDEYLGIADEPARAVGRVRDLARRAELDIEDALRRAERRVAAMEARGLGGRPCRFATDFARSLDYYTGLIFEFHDPGATPGRFVAAGGRYDLLLRRLGHDRPVGAIGCAFWLDRLGGART